MKAKPRHWHVAYHDYSLTWNQPGPASRVDATPYKKGQAVAVARAWVREKGGGPRSWSFTNGSYDCRWVGLDPRHPDGPVVVAATCLDDNGCEGYRPGSPEQSASPNAHVGSDPEVLPADSTWHPEDTHD
jgi:hypothetical protein